MSLVTCDMSISVDGFVAGPDQSRENPIGIGGMELHRWHQEPDELDQPEADLISSAGAYIMGRHMFGPDRGEWDTDWTGWWGDEPPYHAPVFVLTHHPREPVIKEGGTTFTFVTDGIESALEQARDAAGDGNVDIAGGAQTVNAFLAADHIDELRLRYVPIVLGAGERLFDGVESFSLAPSRSLTTRQVSHVVYRRP